MVSRTNTSKTIRRRRGGQSDKERLTAEKAMTGEIGAHKRTSLEKINRERGDWEMVPGTGTSPYNPPEWRKKKITKADRKKYKAAAETAAPLADTKDMSKPRTYRDDDAMAVVKSAGLENKAMREELRRISAEQRAKTKAARDLHLSDPQTGAAASGSGLYSKGGTVKKKYGGSPKKKKATNKKRQTKKTYGGHHGSKYVAKLYD